MESYPLLGLLVEDDADNDTESLKTLKTESGTQTKKRIISSGVPKGPSRSIKQIIPTQKPKRRKVKLMNWKKYHKLNVIYSFIDELEKDYPAICTVSVIGKSVEGRAIKMLKISNSDASNSAVWLDASIHPREWISTAVLTYIADIIVKNFHRLSTAITNKDWHIVPVLNPDGYEYTHTHDRMWRKNKATHDGEIVGVDLNRNFSYAWGKNGDEGSSNEPNNVFYRGPEPFSEPEAVAVRDTILGSTTPFKVFLSFHSYFELIIFPWGHKSEPCPDYLSLLEGGTIMARVTRSYYRNRLNHGNGNALYQWYRLEHSLSVLLENVVGDQTEAIYDTTGKTYKVGCTRDMTYNACGTSTDWSYAVAKIPFSYMIELRSKRYKFKLPRDQIIDNCTEIWNAVKSLMSFVDQSSEIAKQNGVKS